MKTLVLSKSAERFFCTGCGTPIAMSYHFEEGWIDIVFGSVNLETLKGEVPKVEQHIFLKEKAPWVVIPEDGAERKQTSSFAKQLGLE